MGRKRWAMLPPSVRTPGGMPPTPDGYGHPEDAGYFDYWDPARNQGGWWGITQPHQRPDVSAREYFENILPEASGDPAPLECTLQAGELIYIPQGWWHTVLNLEPTIAYTETYVAAADDTATGAAAQSIGELMKRPAYTWEDNGNTVPTMPAKCLADLRAAFPQLFGGSAPLEHELQPQTEQLCAEDDTEACAAAVSGSSTPAVRDVKDVALDEAWGRPKNERTVANALSRHKRGFPLLIRGSFAERWTMADLWNSSYLFDAWDEGLMPSLRGIHGRSKARGSDFVICKGTAPLAEHITVRECNGDGTAPLQNVFEPPLDPSEMYWDDGVLKGGGFKGTNGEFRVWKGPVSDLGMTLRSHVGVREGKIVDDIAVTHWTDLLLFEYHKVHDVSKGMEQIQALRKNHNDDHEALFEKLHGKCSFLQHRCPQGDLVAISSLCLLAACRPHTCARIRRQVWPRPSGIVGATRSFAFPIEGWRRCRLRVRGNGRHAHQCWGCCPADDAAAGSRVHIAGFRIEGAHPLSATG